VPDKSFQDRNLPSGEDQCQFIRKTLFLPNNSLAVFFSFLRFVHEFHGLPVRYMAAPPLQESSLESVYPNGCPTGWLDRRSFHQTAINNPKSTQKKANTVSTCGNSSC
jgi:hypothetical protein